jgi:hypothetical protein
VKEDGAVKRQSFKTAVVSGIFLSWKRSKGKEIFVLLRVPFLANWRICAATLVS